MKRVAVLGIASLFLLTGCGSKVVCKGTAKENGEKVNMKVTATLKKDKIDKVSAKMSFSKKDTAKQYCSLFEAAKALGADSGVDVKCSGKTIEFKDYAQVTGEKLSGMTKADFIKEMEAQDLTCK